MSKLRIPACLLALLLLASCAPPAEEPPTEALTQASTQASTTSEAATTIRDYGKIYDADNPPGPSDFWLGLSLPTEADRASFLAMFGITEATAPFYQYYDNGALQLELYYDFAKREGVGIYHNAGTNAHFGMEGFRVGAPEQAAWKDHKFLITTECHDDLSGAADWTGYEESKRVDKRGKPTEFHATYREDGETRDLIHVTWSYRKDGTLRLKGSYIGIDGTGRSYETFYYDKKERPVYASAYFTSGGIEDFYIYEGSGQSPAYRLTVMHAAGPTHADEFIKYF